MSPPPPAPTVDVAAIDLPALRADLDALRDRLRAGAGDADRRHLDRMFRLNRLCFALGYGTAWLGVNPVSAALIGLGLYSRWTVLAHPILHRGYDRIEGMPRHRTSKGFARGGRRWLDWPEWMHPETWCHEHNTLHHYRLGEEADPDQPERNLAFLRDSRLPMAVRWLLVAVFAMFWKVYYYPSNSEACAHAHARRRDATPPAPPTWPMDRRLWLPWHAIGRRTWLRSWLPYAVFRFGLVPLPFLALGTGAWLAVLINSALGEVVSNVHGFITIVPNHAGDDVHRFDEGITDRGEFYLRQIVGSVNFTTGGDAIDFAHGWLNYQIEHHLWPDMTLLQYRRAQPEVRAICAKHGVPYVQQSVWRRLRRLVAVMVGAATMPHWPTRAATRSATPPAAGASCRS